MTIKEAFAKHDQAVEDFVEGARLGVGLEAMCALEEDEERTIRVLMLAVLDEAVEAVAHDCGRMGAPGSSFKAADSRAEALRTSIKEQAL